jgi:hypothetical protein
LIASVIGKPFGGARVREAIEEAVRLADCYRIEQQSRLTAS